MELKINTTAKTVTVTGEVNVGELFAELQKMLGSEFGNYKIVFEALYIPPYVPNIQPIITPYIYPSWPYDRITCQPSNCEVPKWGSITVNNSLN